MRKVFNSHEQVSHIWASQSQDEGRAGNIFFEGEKIYSYGYHFCIARFAPEFFAPVVLFTNRGYSNSTAKHKGIVSRAIPRDYQIVYCYAPDKSIQTNVDYWLHKIDGCRADFDKKKHKISRGNLAVEIQGYINEAMQYFSAAGIAYPEWFTQSEAELSAIKYIAERNIALETKREARREALRIEQAKKASERMEKWLNGENTYTGDFYHLDTMLRLNGDQVETSRGAFIPIQDAINLYPMLTRAKESGKTLDFGLHAVKIGNYQFRSFDGELLTIGCHEIKWDQIQSIAKQLNLAN
jgi:hypothetical protein